MAAPTRLGRVLPPFIDELRNVGTGVCKKTSSPVEGHRSLSAVRLRVVREAPQLFGLGNPRARAGVVVIAVVHIRGDAIRIKNREVVDKVAIRDVGHVEDGRKEQY